MDDISQKHPSSVESRSPDIYDDLKAPALTDADEGLQALQAVEQSGLELNPAAAKKIRLMADLIVMPCLCFSYMVLFLDKSALPYSAVMGLEEPAPLGIGLSEGQYSWLGSIFFFGFLAAEIVNGRLLQRLPIGKYVGISVILWGVVLACFSRVENFAQGMGLRFLLGLFQAGLSPAIILIVSQWYTREEQIMRTAVWVSFSGIAMIVGGSTAYGLFIHMEAYDILAWRLTYIIFGVIAIFIGILVLIFLPDSQLNAWWLSPDMRVLAVERVRKNQQGIGNKKFKWYQIRELLGDGFFWAIIFFGFACNVPNGGLNNFFTLIIQGLGLGPQDVLIWATPAGGVAIVLLLSWGLISLYFGIPIFAAIGALLIMLCGMLMLIAIPATSLHARLAGYYLTMALPVPEASAAILISQNVAGYTKKTTTCAMFFLAYCVGNIVGPQIFRDDDAPDYRPAEITICVLIGLCILDLIFIYFLLRRRNVQKEALRASAGHVHAHGQEFFDLTDKENPDFVYSF